MLESAANYSASWLVKFYHAWPHMSFSFVVLKEEEFSFDNYAYLESLAMIALIVTVWLLLTMIAFGVYFCCLRVRGDTDAKYNGNSCYCSVCVFIVFLMLNLGAIGVAMFGNMQSDDGLKVAAAAVREGNKTLAIINDKILTFGDLSRSLVDNIDDLESIRIHDQDVVGMREAAVMIDAEINAYSLSGVEDRLAWSIEVFVVTAQYRNLITFCLLGFQCLVCFVALFGLCCRSKCTLITTIVLGMFCITATYFYLGITLLVNVTVSDFCIDPVMQINNQTVEKGYMTQDLADYFLKCEPGTESPLLSELEKVDGLLYNISSQVSRVNATKNITEDEEAILIMADKHLQGCKSVLTELESSLDCKSTKRSLDMFIPAICGTAMEGLFALGAAMLGIGICMSFALCAAAKTAKRYGKPSYGDSRGDVDFHDPFLPRPTRYHSGSNRNLNITRTNNPIYATTTSSNSNFGVASNTLSFFRHGSDEDISLLENPPPYSPPRPNANYT